LSGESLLAVVALLIMRGLAELLALALTARRAGTRVLLAGVVALLLLAGVG
jgi:hypothetical protein